MSGYKSVGYISKSFGTKGHLRFSLDVGIPIDLIKKKFVFLHLNGSYVPFYIEAINEDQSNFKLEWINTPEEALKYSHQAIYLPIEQIPNIQNETLSERILSFDFFNEDKNYIGKIVSVEEYPSQIMLTIKDGDKEFLIPFHEDLIIEMHDQKLIYKIADGMLNI